MKKGVQRAMLCRCGNANILAHGLCPTCYTLKRQDAEYFGGLREVVLERDGYRCRVCDAPGRRKRSIVVHHRRRGKSLLHLMIALCPACHAKVSRTRTVRSEMPALLLKLWREQHPEGHEQTMLDFSEKKLAGTEHRLFEEGGKGSDESSPASTSLRPVDGSAVGCCTTETGKSQPPAGLENVLLRSGPS